MNNLLLAILFIVIFLFRWVSIESPLPKNWEPDTQIGYTVTVLDNPEYQDSRTIVRSGTWYISIKGYNEVIPGSVVRFEGQVEPEYVLGKVRRIVMLNPKYEVVGKDIQCLSCRVQLVIGEWRSRWVGMLARMLPVPMASLASGILLGVKGQTPQDFYQALVNTGTLHIIAASGFNVTIVSAVIMSVAMTMVGRGVSIGIGVVGIIAYVLIAGSSTSVVRAGIMGSLTLMAYYLGRPTEARRLLWVTGAIMLLHNPLMLFDVGFELSFSATLGLLYLGKWIERGGDKIFDYLRFQSGIKSFLSEYLYPTLAATMATLPVIMYHFGRISLISPLVNMLVLPLVPIVMGMSALVIVAGMIYHPFGQVLAWTLYGPLAWIVGVITWFGQT